MLAAPKEWIKARWPRLRLRAIVFATLFLVAALPGVGAVFLRVYENTLVRQTEAELVAQGDALAAAAAVLWPGATGPVGQPEGGNAPPPQADTVDLSTTPIRPERPAPSAAAPPAPDAEAAARALEPILSGTRTATLASILLLDRHGRIVTGTRPRGSLAALPEVAAALRGQPTTVLRRNGDYRATYRFEWLSRAAAIRIHHARPVIVGGRVVGVLLLSRTARALFRGLYDDRGKILLGIAAILGLLVVLSGLLSRGITRPIEQLGQATRAVANGRGTVPEAPRTAAIEIQGLYADFAVMAAAIERRSRYLRDFAHAVSHEFKTPLAGIRGAIELLSDHPDMAPGDRRRFLANADADAGRLTLLVTRLLELARADMAAPGSGTADLSAALDRIDGIAVDRALPPGLPPAAIAPDTLDAVLSTLADNARQAGARTLRIEATATADRIALRLSDDGPGLAPADRARLFEPFFTTRRTQGGTGLGLPIARSLLEAAGATIALADDAPGLDPSRAVFVIDLPVA